MVVALTHEPLTEWLMDPWANIDAPMGLEVVHRPAWMSQAACKGMSTTVFFPELGGNLTAARAVCRTCPVQGECLSYADADSELDGVWGGTSGRERRQYRARLSP
ncbi:MAG TPA: WhiB family transcriptional regulator [Acidimicrobiales bacterium]